MRSIITLLTALLMLALVIIVTWGSWQWHQMTTVPLLKNNGVSQISVVDFRENMGLTDLAYLLQTQHLIDDPKLLIMIAQLKHYTTRLQAGIYQVDKTDTLMSLLEKIATGKVIYSHFTLVEGTTLSDTISKLNQAPYLKHDISPSTLAILQQHFQWNVANSEGLFAADTYSYKAGTSGLDLLKRAHAQMMQHLHLVWQQRAPQLPYATPYQLLIAASIIEKETALESERNLIAGVIVNRLNQGMRLQMDPTVIYALGNHYQGKLAHSDLQIASPYNTYRNRGLPPTPICAPSLKSLRAAAHPMATAYLYFVATGKGAHRFSESLAQQNFAVKQYKENIQATQPLMVCLRPLWFEYK